MSAANALAVAKQSPWHGVNPLEIAASLALLAMTAIWSLRQCHSISPVFLVYDWHLILLTVSDMIEVDRLLYPAAAIGED